MADLTFAEYQRAATETAIYPGRGQGNWIYPALGLAGESGEIAEKVKKAIRDEDGRMSDERRVALAKELGDVLWYVAAMAGELGLSLDAVARGNLEKLAKRKTGGTLGGSGDNR